MQKVMRFKRITAYDAPDNPEWLLFRKVIETWIRGSQTPVLLVPIPMWAHFDGTSDPTSYQARFNELASDTGCFLHDPLPDLLANTPEDRRSFRFERDVHFTPKGHHVMAQSIVPTIERIIRENQQ